MSESIWPRFVADGPKRILALDGGGTRGALTIEFLAEIERVLQNKLQQPDSFVLSDYFDLIGGTSVGALLAAMLALGWRVDRVRGTFESWAPKIFPWWRIGSLVQPRFRANVLERKIREIVGEDGLRSSRLRTGLCIVAKRADTNSVWVLTNNSAARYWIDQSGDNWHNADYQIADMLRATTAAPTFFHPIDIQIHHPKGRRPKAEDFGRFVDGGVSPHNNPSLQLLMLASMQGYNLGGAAIEELRAGRGKSWPLGPENLLMISVGTGSFPVNVKRRWFHALEAVEALKSMIGDAEQLVLSQMQSFSATGRKWLVDSEIGNLDGHVSLAEATLRFQRYDVRLTRKWLSGDVRSGDIVPGPELKLAAQRHGLLRRERDERRIQRLVNLSGMPILRALGQAAAKEQVRIEDFPDTFDHIWQPPGPWT